MLKFFSLAILVISAITLPSALHRRAETLKFAWPDGASAKVNVRSEGRRVSSSKTNSWDMSLDFTMQLKRVNGRIEVSRKNFSGWKGTFPPSFGGGAERFVHMVPTMIVTEGGAFVGIEGHDTARRLMNQAVEQAGGLNPIERNAFEVMSTNAAIEAMAKDFWANLVLLWQDVELDPEVSYEINSVASVPQLGGGEIQIDGSVKFVKETPCGSTRTDLRCMHLHAETGANKMQVQKMVESLLQRADPNTPIAITAFDRQFKVDIVVEKTTMLPQQLKITRIHGLTVKEKKSGHSDAGAEEYSATHTFTWLPPAEIKK